jgi:hypothetical protein
VISKRVALNTDGPCTGTSLRDLLRVADLARTRRSEVLPGYDESMPSSRVRAQAGGDECANDLIASEEADDYLISASETADNLSRIVTFAP